MIAEAIEQWRAQAKRQRHGMSRLVMAAGLIALNVGQCDVKLMSAKQHYSALNLDPERGGRGPGGNPIQAQRVACAMQVPRRSDEKEAGLGMETLKLKSGAELDVSRRVSVSRHVFECLGLAMPMSRLGPWKSRKMVMSRSRHEKNLVLKQHSGL